MKRPGLPCRRGRAARPPAAGRCPRRPPPRIRRETPVPPSTSPSRCRGSPTPGTRPGDRSGFPTATSSTPPPPARAARRAAPRAPSSTRARPVRPSPESHETIPCPSTSGRVGQTVATTVIAAPSGRAARTRAWEPRWASCARDGQLPSKSEGTGTSLTPGSVRVRIAADHPDEAGLEGPLRAAAHLEFDGLAGARGEPVGVADEGDVVGGRHRGGARPGVRGGGRYYQRRRRAYAGVVRSSGRT